MSINWNRPVFLLTLSMVYFSKPPYAENVQRLTSRYWYQNFSRQFFFFHLITNCILILRKKKIFFLIIARRDFQLFEPLFNFNATYGQLAQMPEPILSVLLWTSGLTESLQVILHTGTGEKKIVLKTIPPPYLQQDSGRVEIWGRAQESFCSIVSGQRKKL